MAEDKEKELERIEVRLPKGKIRKFMNLIPKGTRSTYVLDLIHTDMLKEDRTYLKKRETDLEFELERLKSLKDYNEHEEKALKDNLSSLIDKPELQMYFEGYYGLLNPENPYRVDQVQAESHASSWLKTRIIDFQEEVGHKFSIADFKESFMQWRNKYKPDNK